MFFYPIPVLSLIDKNKINKMNKIRQLKMIFLFIFIPLDFMFPIFYLFNILMFFTFLFINSSLFKSVRKRETKQIKQNKTNKWLYGIYMCKGHTKLLYCNI